MSKLTVVGSINADLIVHAERHPQPGETLLGLSLIHISEPTRPY